MQFFLIFSFVWWCRWGRLRNLELMGHTSCWVYTAFILLFNSICFFVLFCWQTAELGSFEFSANKSSMILNSFLCTIKLMRTVSFILFHSIPCWFLFQSKQVYWEWMKIFIVDGISVAHAFLSTSFSVIKLDDLGFSDHYLKCNFLEGCTADAYTKKIISLAGKGF